MALRFGVVQAETSSESSAAVVRPLRGREHQGLNSPIRKNVTFLLLIPGLFEVLKLNENVKIVFSFSLDTKSYARVWEHR